MKQVIDLVLAQIDPKRLENLLGQLRILDNELDIQIEEIHAAQRDVTVIDRINIFTVSDSEQALKEKNMRYGEVKHRHAEIVELIKDLIREAIYRDFNVALKVQSAEITRAVAALRVEHRWSVNTKVHRYQIHGIGALRDRIDHLADMIDSKYDFPSELLDAETLLHLVYDRVLLEGGFIG